jgi:hypothetical protein
MASVSVLRTPNWASGSLSHPDASRIETVRVTTGSVGASSQAEVAATYDAPFATTGYTLMVAVEESTATTDTLQIKKVVSKTTTGCTIRLINNNASPRTGLLHITAIGD